MRLFYFIYFLTSVVLLKAQQYCGTDVMQARWFASHPELKAKYESAFQKRKAAQQTINASPEKGVAAVADYTIPVVFHILHQGGSENISDAQVKDAVKI